MLLGAYCTRGCGLSRRSFTPTGRVILHLAHELAALRPGDARYEPYISVNVNQNQHLCAHRDLQNWEHSWVLGLGEYLGGEMWIADESRACRHALPLALHGDLPADTLGRLVKVRRKWFRFSGRHWHAVLEAEGYRASLTLFTPRAHHLLTVGHWRQLAQLGFPVHELLKRMLAREDSVSSKVRR
eukprot:6252250-Amphidinium_carterae.1